MYFALGALLATLVALLVLPAVWHRAVRLTTRRVEAAIPVSIFEIQADKDQQRAAFALSQRRLELQTDQLRDAIVEKARDVEAHRLAAMELQKALAAAEARYQDLTGVRDNLSADLSETRALRTQNLAQIESHAQEIAALKATLAEAQAQIAVRSDELEATRAAAANERARAQRAVEKLSADMSETIAALASKARESDARAETIAGHDAEVAELKATLAAAETDLEASRSVVHTLEHRRADEFATAQEDVKRLALNLDRLKADHAMMEAALTHARTQGEAQPMGAGMGDGRAVLKAALADLAAKMVVLAATAEGRLPEMKALRSAPAAGDGDLAGRIRALAADPAALVTPTEAPAPVEAVDADGAGTPSPVRESGAPAANGAAPAEPAIESAHASPPLTPTQAASGIETSETPSLEPVNDSAEPEAETFRKAAS